MSAQDALTDAKLRVREGLAEGQRLFEERQAALDERLRRVLEQPMPPMPTDDPYSWGDVADSLRLGLRDAATLQDALDAPARKVPGLLRLLNR